MSLTYKYDKLAKDIYNKLSYNEKKMIITFIFNETNVPITRNDRIIILDFSSATTSDDDYKKIREKVNIFINKYT